MRSTSSQPLPVSAHLLADILSVSYATIKHWEDIGKLVPIQITDKEQVYDLNQLTHLQAVKEMLNSTWVDEPQPASHSSIELFAGAGGLAIGLEKAGFEATLLNEIDHDACDTLRKNRPHWQVKEGDIRIIDFKPFAGIDFLSGGFPCQAFSYAGQQRGFDDARGTLFFEMARAIQETQPKVFMAENVKGLLTHDQGRTLQTIKKIIHELGYVLIEPRVLKALFYKVPQKRERLFLIGIRQDLLPLIDLSYLGWPSPYHRVLTLRDAFTAGDLYDCDVPLSEGTQYPPQKAKILAKVPEGGDWRDLSIAEQKEYMKGSFELGGGKTGMARRLSWDLPSLTLTCSPAQKQTERCHPVETRPLTIREYARIQTFPDHWNFSGSVSSQYKQIGNAVPVNLAFAMGLSLSRLLSAIKAEKPQAGQKHPRAFQIDPKKKLTVPDLPRSKKGDLVTERSQYDLPL